VLQCIAARYRALQYITMCYSVRHYSCPAAPTQVYDLMECVAGCAVCRSVLECVASALQRVAVHCSVLQCVAVCCSVLQCVAVCCSVLQCVAEC